MRAFPTLRLVLGDQLSPTLSALDDLDPAHDVVLLAEVMEECTYVRHHAKKIVLVLAGMRHFAQALQHRGVRVHYVKLDAAENTGTLTGEVMRAAALYRPSRIVATEPGEWRLLEAMRHWHEQAGIEVDIRDDTRFLCSRRDFAAWAGGKRTLRMEFFYRDMRKRYGLLLEDGLPAGGRWNYDPENRKPLPARARPPAPPRFKPDTITREVMTLVAARFASHFGSVEDFSSPVTARQAEAALADFLAHRLAQFGDWQDAMKTGEPFLFHACISFALNLGLLDPLAICRRAEAAWRDGTAPLNAVEGFIRQILGWREFVRGIYWLHMPEYGRRNALDAQRRLPWFYWSGQTRMNCLHQAITGTRDHAYAHHIQRLMITGNFALIAGLSPDEVDEWYMVVYADAYQWVEMPNTRGMALFADGGVVGSKPYAASGAYINRMSDYCRACHYDVKQSTGPRACPFNFLYWDFIARHEDRFAANTRMAMPLATWRRMDPARRAALRSDAAAFLSGTEMTPDPPAGENRQPALSG